MKSSISPGAGTEVLNHVHTNHVSSSFNEADVIHELHHYLPEQASLKDFIHQNTLHAFQDKSFFEGLRHASQILGYKVSLSLREYRTLYNDGKINADVLKRVITERWGA